MNCSDCRYRIAAEDLSPEVAEHCRECAYCRAFAGDLELNAAALRSLTADAASYAVVRERVMAAVSKEQRRGAWWWAAGAAAAAVLCIAFLWPRAAVLFQADPPAPAPVAYRVAAPDVPVPVSVPSQPARRSRMGRPRVYARKQRESVAPLTAIKLLTDDPDVVIIWLPNDKENKKGDSL